MLDERTILLMIVIIPTLLAAVTSGLRLAIPDDVRGIGSWSMCLLCFGLGSAIVALTPLELLGSRVLISNAVFVPAVALTGYATARFFRRPLRPRWWIAAAVLVYAVAAMFSQHPEQAPIRIALLSLQQLVCSGIAIHAALSSGELRRGPGGTVLLIGLSLLACGAAIRFSAAVSQNAGPVTIFSGATFSVVPVFLMMVNLGLLFGTLGLILLASERMRARLEHLASHDALTGLLSRGGFSPLVEHTLAFAKRQRQTASLAILDVDLFKQVNDRYGHQTGDAALRVVAQVLRAQLRQIDLCARFGGEEFAVLLPACDLQGAAQIAERVREAIAAAPIPHDPEPFHLTVSIGLSATSPTNTEFQQLYREADKALYSAKANGRNRVEKAVDEPDGMVAAG